jgi:organic hydroperoxide reductase OsmC/OhrA
MPVEYGKDLEPVMSDHFAEVHWQSNPHAEQDGTFSRDHQVVLENGHSLLNSSAPAYFGNAAAANPETLLLAALASCHMLTFLAITAKRGFAVEQYDDRAEGLLGKNAAGRMAIVSCTLNPVVRFTGASPSAEELGKFHDSAHRNCFIANTLSAEVRINT